MADDSEELSAGVEIAPTGVTLKARSRFLSMIDRWGASKLAKAVAEEESTARILDAETSGRERIIAAAAEQAVKQIERDPRLASELLDKHFAQITRSAENVEGVVRETLEDLRLSPPSESENDSGVWEINPETLDRMHRYAEDASTQELRHKWGRILATEIRKPGTVTNKVLRIVDELQPEEAKIFERLSSFRIGADLPVALHVLTYRESTSMIGAGLFVDPGPGIYKTSSILSSDDGAKKWFCKIGEEFALSFPVDADLDALGADYLNYGIAEKDGGPTVQVNTLTPEGIAIAAVVSDNSEAAMRQLLEHVRSLVPAADLFRYVPGANKWRSVDLS